VQTGIPLNEAEPLLLFSIAFTLLAAVNEGSGKFEEE
jgi:photosystem II protein